MCRLRRLTFFGPPVHLLLVEYYAEADLSKAEYTPAITWIQFPRPTYESIKVQHKIQFS